MSSELSVIRRYVADAIEEHLPEGWEIEDGIPTLGILSRPVLWLEYTGFSPLEGTHPAAGHVAVQMTVCIVTNLQDNRKGEADADDRVATLYHALVATRKLFNITADKTVFLEKYFGWKLTVTVATNAIPTT